MHLFGGKGGVGKTTAATATALGLANEGYRTLLVSTDPAHSTADLLDARSTVEPSAVAPRLSLVEIDGEAAAQQHVERIRADAEGSLSRAVLPTVRRHLHAAASSPGTVEAAVLDRLVDLLDACPDEFDRVVVDTAPTGHTLRLLALPELLSAWVEGLARQRERVAGTERMLHHLAGEQREGDPLLDRLRRRQARYRRARQRLVDDAALWLVTIPERLAVAEAARAAQWLDETGLRIAGVVVNQVLPAAIDGAFFRERQRQQETYLAEIAERFASVPRCHVEQRPREISTRADLTAISAQLEPLYSSPR